MDYLRKTTKSANWTYRRRVPQDIQEAFGKAWVEQSLGTPDRREARKRAAIMTAKLEETWDTMRGKGSDLQRWQQGVSWLSEQEPIHEDAPSEDMWDALKKGKDSLPPGATEESYLAWLRGIKTLDKPTVTLSAAFDLWVRECKPSKQAERGANRIVKQFSTIVPESIDISLITRLQARRYRDSLIAGGAAPGSISTYISYLRTIFNTAMSEELINDKSNPFAEIKVEKDKSQMEEREPIPRDICIDILSQSLKDGFDQADWFAAILLTTGMRPIEAFGAKLVRSSDVTYWDVPRAKTSPPRQIPVHPLLLDKTPVPFTVRPEQLRRMFIERHKPYTGYQCRHSWKDEADKLDMPLELNMRLMGHSTKKAIGVHVVYGKSSIDMGKAKPWIDRMWQP